MSAQVLAYTSCRFYSLIIFHQPVRISKYQPVSGIAPMGRICHRKALSVPLRVLTRLRRSGWLLGARNSDSETIIKLS